MRIWNSQVTFSEYIMPYKVLCWHHRFMSSWRCLQIVSVSYEYIQSRDQLHSFDLRVN